MKERELYIVGWVSDAHGIRGESYIRFYTKSPDWLSEVSEFTLAKISPMEKERLKKKRKAEFLDSSEIISEQIYKFSKVKPHKQGVIIKFESIKDRNQAEDLKGLIVQIPYSTLNSSGSEGFYFHQIMGFNVFDQNNRDCGVITSHYNNGAHDIIVLENNFPAKEVPFVDDWIVNINFEQKFVKMNLPDGLLEIEV